MPRKEKTPAEKKAWGEKMRLAKEAKAQERLAKADDTILGDAHTVPEATPSVPEMTTPSEPSVADLMKRILELEQRQFFQASQSAPGLQQQGAQVSARGLVGTVTKYSVNPKDYPDPRDQLFEEPKLRLKGFNRDWWDLEFTITPVNYDTKDGIHMSEPKFQIRLIRIVEDPDTGEPSNKRYVLWKGSFFEDEGAAIAVAAQHGIQIPPELEASFLNEMRYLRMRDWLMEAFYPPKPTQDKANKVETVIANRLVEVYEINSVNSETIPFEKLSKKF